MPHPKKFKINVWVQSHGFASSISAFDLVVVPLAFCHFPWPILQILIVVALSEESREYGGRAVFKKLKIRISFCSGGVLVVSPMGMS